MSLPSQQISPGRLETAFRMERERLSAGDAVRKMWSRQAELWTSEPEHARIIENRLGWISVLDGMREEAGGLAQFASELREAGYRDIVLLGMGGSSLAPEVFSLVFPRPADGRRFFLLDTTDPASIRGVERAVDLRRAVFVVASKSGRTAETLSQFFYFHHRLHADGIRPPGPSFLAITDADSYVSQLAAEYKFRRSFLNPADIGGRYSALSYFGLVPAALWGVELGGVLDSAIDMRAACGPSVPAGTNPALALGALLGAGATCEPPRTDRLVLLSTRALVPLGNWIEQLVAESTGKQGKGILPVAGGVAPPTKVLAEGCIVAGLSLASDDAAPLEATLDSLEPLGVPIVRLQLDRPEALGAAFFLWELATALAGAVLGIDPFDEPNVQESKDNTTRLLEQFQSSGQLPGSTPRLAELGIEFYAEGPVRHTVSTLRASEALRTFFAQRKASDYLALLAYVERSAANARQLDELRTRLGERLGLPVLLGYGPRYLHSIGQFYKGGPAAGMFLLITAMHPEDLAIPGAKYTFGQLQMAQALGDLESLLRRGKPALRLHLTGGTEAGLPALRRLLDQALAAFSPVSR